MTTIININTATGIDKFYDQRDPTEIFDATIDELRKQINEKSVFTSFKVFIRNDFAMPKIVEDAMRNVLILSTLREYYPKLKNYAISIRIYEYGLVLAADKPERVKSGRD
jgi:hypothetical protein